MSVDLDIRGVDHRYGRGGPPVLRDVSLRVAAGTVTTILGPSGGGKSTLLSVVAGLETPTGGDVQIDGESVPRVPPARRGIALVLQQPHLFPHMSVGENVTFGLAARGVDRATRTAEAARWLEMVELGGMADRRPRELSGGEQQRVALVRALASEPRLLLLDEPLASLDPLVRAGLQTLLGRLIAETGVTAVMVTHDRTEAMLLGDHTALLIDGRLAAHGPPQDLFRRPPTREAARFMGVTTFIDGTVQEGRLLTAAGPLVVDALPTAGEMTVAIRPEHVVLGAAGDTNRIDGVVAACAFHGEFWDCVVDTPLGAIRARGDRPRASGEPVTLGLPPAHLFPLGAVEPESG